jgi:hypothetical protein
MNRVVKFASARVRTGRPAAAAAALAFALAAPALAQDKPVGEPVRWDQPRVTKYAKELASAVEQAKEAVRKTPLDQNISQTRTYRDLLETMRLLDNTSEHLAAELAAGKDQEETVATFDRIGSLRLQAEESGRRAEIPAATMDALVHAGELHNRLKPYYYGLR